MKGWPANPELVRHLKSNLIRTCVHVDEAVMGLSVHTDGDGEGDNPLLHRMTPTPPDAADPVCGESQRPCRSRARDPHDHGFSKMVFPVHRSFL